MCLKWFTTRTQPFKVNLLPKNSSKLQITSLFTKYSSQRFAATYQENFTFAAICSLLRLVCSYFFFFYSRTLSLPNTVFVRISCVSDQMIALTQLCKVTYLSKSIQNGKVVFLQKFVLTMFSDFDPFCERTHFKRLCTREIISNTWYMYSK